MTIDSLYLHRFPINWKIVHLQIQVYRYSLRQWDYQDYRLGQSPDQEIGKQTEKLSEFITS